uniref:Uncharacterized protein n=1 Tax=Clastoptera arizonana TaxID=38151 RepID=A0A1B6CPM4_9HEMI
MTEKRNIQDSTFNASNIILDFDVCVQDILKDILPYIKENTESFINSQWDSTDFQGIINKLKTEAKNDKEKNLEGFVEIPEDGEEVKSAVIKHLLWQFENNTITTAGRNILGQILSGGLKSGDLKVKINKDIAKGLKTWSSNGRQIFIISTFSIEDQKAIFSHTEEGDLISFITNYFDEEIGSVLEKRTFAKILEKLDCLGSATMFISNKQEGTLAASASGLVSLLISKDGKTADQLSDLGDVIVFTTVSEIEFETISKRQKLSDEKVIEEDRNFEKSDVEKMDVCEEPTHKGQGDMIESNVETQCGIPKNGQGDLLNNVIDSVKVTCKSEEESNPVLEDKDASKETIVISSDNDDEFSQKTESNLKTLIENEKTDQIDINSDKTEVQLKSLNGDGEEHSNMTKVQEIKEKGEGKIDVVEVIEADEKIDCNNKVNEENALPNDDIPNNDKTLTENTTSCSKDEDIKTNTLDSGNKNDIIDDQYSILASKLEKQIVKECNKTELVDTSSIPPTVEKNRK